MGAARHLTPRLERGATAGTGFHAAVVVAQTVRVLPHGTHVAPIVHKGRPMRGADRAER
jgi:hypothetical protein